MIAKRDSTVTFSYHYLFISLYNNISSRSDETALLDAILFSCRNGMLTARIMQRGSFGATCFKVFFCFLFPTSLYLHNFFFQCLFIVVIWNWFAARLGRWWWWFETDLLLIFSSSFPDIDECQLPESVCLAGTQCHNLQGSYRCISGKKNHLGQCPPGFARNLNNHFCDGMYLYLSGKELWAVW